MRFSDAVARHVRDAVRRAFHVRARPGRAQAAPRGFRPPPASPESFHLPPATWALVRAGQAESHPQIDVDQYSYERVVDTHTFRSTVLDLSCESRQRHVEFTVEDYVIVTIAAAQVEDPDRECSYRLHVNSSVSGVKSRIVAHRELGCAGED